jgi:pimeloyl-ACP methyl ester carboxylesterase
MTTIHEFSGRAGTKPTVVCLHATAGSGAQWTSLAGELRHDCRVLTPDLYGHGGTPAWPGDPVDIVAADAARIGRLVAGAEGAVHLVGHSYGGAIALRVALARPERVASVVVYEPVPMRVLFDFSPKQRAAAEVAEVADEIRRAMNGGSFERAAERFIDYWAGGGQWARLAPEQRAGVVRRLPVIRAHFASLRHDAVRLGDYARIAAPVLYLAGRDTRASARRIAELMTFALPSVELEMRDKVGHLGPITDPVSVAQRIASFVREHAAQSAIEHRKAA